MTKEYPVNAEVLYLFTPEPVDDCLLRSPEEDEAERKIARETLRISLQREGDIDY
jgi:hypothetical protein